MSGSFDKVGRGSQSEKLTTGQTVERYTVEGRIGKGGVARVYLVRHNTLGSLHALKVLRIHDDMMKERLVQEGQVQASLRHPNIVAVTDVVDVAGSPGLVMDYVDGPSLDHWLQENRPNLAQAEAIFRGILAGVARAHKIGLVHRDLKPANVLMAVDDDGTLIPKVADFGLAKILIDDEGDGPGSHTRSGTTMGTPAYMAPEQVRDAKSVDQRADIFALGCILYELCTGVSPFYHPDLFAIFSALASGTYTPPQSLAPELPARITNAITGSLTVHRENRISSCTVLQRVLEGSVTEDWSSLTFTDEAPRLAAAASIGPSKTDRAGPSRDSLATPNPNRSLKIAGGLTVGVLGVLGLFAAAVVVLVVAGVAWFQLAPGPEPVAEAPVEPPPAVVAPPVAPEVPVAAPEAPPVVVAPPSPGPRPVAPAPAPAAPTTGTVTAAGDADEVWLEGPNGRVELGVVPVGEYRIKAAFKGEAAAPAGRATVRAGQTLSLSCSAAFQMCQAR